MRREQMAKGIIYVMSTVFDGLIKIGKTETDNYQQGWLVVFKSLFKEEGE